MRIVVSSSAPILIGGPELFRMLFTYWSEAHSGLVRGQT